VPHLGNTGGTSGNLDGLDYRLLGAHLRNGRLWVSSNVATDNAGSTSGTDTRMGVRWYELQNIATGQTPGVVQNSYGQLHIRGDHANVQYRINGVIIPESISGFGQALETRFADHLSILTGALPAQYGYRNAAVVDIQSKGDAIENGGSIGFTGGSHGHAETTAELSGTRGPLTYYLTGSYLRDNMGIENPTAERNALHDQTQQTKGFGYLSYLLGADSRVSVLFGTTNNRFQIPNVPGQTPSFTLDSRSASRAGHLT